jgi:hypothetical protein
MNMEAEKILNSFAVLLAAVSGSLLAALPFFYTTSANVFVLLSPFIALYIFSFLVAIFTLKNLTDAIWLSTFPMLTFSGGLGVSIFLGRALIYGDALTNSNIIYFSAALLLCFLAWCQYRLTSSGIGRS